MACTEIKGPTKSLDMCSLPIQVFLVQGCGSLLIFNKRLEQFGQSGCFDILAISYLTFFSFCAAYFCPFVKSIYLNTQIKITGTVRSRSMSTFVQRTLTYFVRGNITVRLTSCLTGQNLAKQANLFIVSIQQNS